jgi:SNF2 family DNA or RNA helicase
LQRNGSELEFYIQICPTSIVNNWAKEISKWLGERLEGTILAITCPRREDVIDQISKFCSQVRNAEIHFILVNITQRASSLS